MGLTTRSMSGTTSDLCSQLRGDGWCGVTMRFSSWGLLPFFLLSFQGLARYFPYSHVMRKKNTTTPHSLVITSDYY